MDHLILSSLTLREKTGGSQQFQAEMSFILHSNIGIKHGFSCIDIRTLTASNLWPRYEHIESAYPCINSA